MAATAVNLHTLLNPSPRRLRSPLPSIMDTRSRTTAMAMGAGMELGTLSTITQQDFMLTMATTEKKVFQARWEALASAPHIGEIIKTSL